MSYPHILRTADVTADPSQVCIQSATVSCDASAASTAFTFAALELHPMADANYQLIATASAASTTALQVTAKATTGFTITHQNSAGAKIASVLVIGKVHNA